MNKSYTCYHSLETRDSSPLCYTVDQYMGGRPKISTSDATTRARLSPCLRSKMGTASEDTPKLSGHLIFLVSILVIVILCSSISQNNEVFKAKRQAQRYTAIVVMDLISVEVLNKSYVHLANHLMVIKGVDHFQINLVMELLLILPVTTCSLTRKIIISQ
jgi:hypothetical protein